jgi:hypothetical protein
MCSNDEFQHQAFWDKVVNKLNEEQTWLSQQEELFMRERQRENELLFCKSLNLTEDKTLRYQP